MTKFEKTAACLAIEQRLSQGSPGNEIGAAEMAAICGQPCDGSTTDGWKTVARVIPRIERQCGLVWKWQRDTMSWRCLTDPEKPGVLDDRVKRMRRQSGRVLVVADTIDFAALDEPTKKATICSMVIAGAIRTLTSNQSRKRIETTVNDKPKLPNPEALIAACQARQ